MNIEIKKSIKPIKYEDAIKLLEERLLEINNGQKEDLIWILEHEEVYSAGTSYKEKEILNKNINLVKTNRGGKITYHGPGQLICYFDSIFFTDIHKYLRYLEESVILTLAEYGIVSGRIEGSTGVWLDWDNAKARKICALGVRSSRWVTMHGFAFNVNSDLNYFANIIPCGISDKAVTSLQNELGRPIDMLKRCNY